MGNISNKALIEEFKAHLKTRPISEITKRQYPLYVQVFHNFIGGNLLAVDKKALTKYLTHLQEMKLEFTSIRRYFAGLHAFYDFLVFMDYMTANPISSAFRKYYLTPYKNHDVSQRRQCISLQEAQKLVTSILDPKGRCIVVLFLKTGLRLGELARLDIKDIDMENKTIRIKRTAKRSNEIVYFDDETVHVLTRWLKQRSETAETNALFLDRFEKRLSPGAIERIVNKHAVVNDLHDPASNRHDLEVRLTPHCLRHFWVTQLLEKDMPKDYVEELRGDAIRDAIDIYYHIRQKKIQDAYLRCAPQFGL